MPHSRFPRHLDLKSGISGSLPAVPEIRQLHHGLLGVTQLLEDLRDPANLLDKDAPGGAKVGALLKKSIEVLGFEAQKCFAFLAPFPEKPAHFDQAALNAMWDGITNDPVRMRDLFISRGLLDPTGNGRFWLHALLLAYARSLNAPRGLKPAKLGTD